MALGSTQLLREMSTRKFPGVKGRAERKADNFTAICEPTVREMWEPRPLTTLWAFTAFYRASFTCFRSYIVIYHCQTSVLHEVDYRFTVEGNSVVRYYFDYKRSEKKLYSLTVRSQTMFRYE
jgi:hypothetical protein